MKDYSIYQYSRLVAILHIPLDAFLPFAYSDNFQVTWLRLRRSLRWGTWGRQPFSGATKGGDYAKSKYIRGIFDCPSTQGLKSRSASRLSRFPSKSWMARLVNRLQRCQVDFGSLVLKRNSHLEVSLNQSLQL